MNVEIIENLLSGFQDVGTDVELISYLEKNLKENCPGIFSFELYLYNKHINQLEISEQIKQNSQRYQAIEKCFHHSDMIYSEALLECENADVHIQSTKPAILFPLISLKRTIGVIEIFFLSYSHFTDNDIKIIKTAAGYTALALENIWLTSNVNESKKIIEARENEYQDLLFSLSEMVLIHIDGETVEVNDYGAKFTGYSRDEFLKLIFEEIIDKESLPLVQEKIRERKNNILSGEYEIKLITKAGEKKNVLLKPSFIRYKNKKAVLVTLRDITEKKHLEEVISHERDQLFSLMKNISDTSIYFKDRQNRFTRINESEAKLIGAASTQEVIGKTDFDYFSYSFANGTHEEEQKVMETGIPLIGKLEKHDTKDGVRWISSTKVPITNRDGKITGLVGISHDITKLKQIEMEIKKSEEQFRAIWESSLDGMRLIDENGKTLLVNNAYCDMVGKGREELWGTDFAIIYSEDYRLQIQSETISRLKDRSSNLHIERKTELWNGKVTWFDISHSIIDIDKKSPLLLSIFRDITARKQVEAQLTYRTELEMIVSTISTSFIHFLPEEIEDGVNRTLSGLGKFLGVDRSYIFLTSNDGKYFTNDYEWCNSSILERKISGEKFSVADFPWLVSKLKKHEIVRLPDILTVTDISPFEKNFLEQRMVKSVIIVPMVLAKTLKGFLGFDFVRSEMALMEEDITMLETVADIFIFSFERKRIEDAIKFEKEELSVTLRSIGDGVITTDRNKNIKIINKAAQEILGWSEAEIIGGSIFKLFQLVLNRLDNQESGLEIKSAGNQKNKLQLNEYLEIVTKTGERKIIFVYSVNLNDPNGILNGYVYVIRDVTEQLKIEKRLLLSQKMESIGHLAAGIAHEINTPMQYINDNTTFLKESFASITDYAEDLTQYFNTYREGKLPQEKFDDIRGKYQKLDIPYLFSEIPLAIQETQTGISKVSKIISAMKDFSHPSGKNKAFSDINHTIEVTVTISKNEWKYISELELKLAENLPSVNCAIDEINQVILNMIVNAAHAIEERFGKVNTIKGKILIETQDFGSYIEIRISDNGTGIPKANLQKIFDPFFTTKEVGKGTGQGLSIAHDIIVTKHGGIILVDSELGKGTIFTIQLPVTNE